ncbi:tRNA pseudouridine synthase A [Morus notabilis]|uniref:tRNA pseudouridine synthase n=1 Tax=Morus notabilis TaxID=981085 RepID=W9QMW7_9ROSA|nr:tRNA pseudouridine synthase A [Morus notabilis]
MTEDSKHPLDTDEFSSSQRPLKVAKTAEIPSDDKQEEEQQSGIGPPQKSMSQNPRIQRYLVAIEYVGTRFSGSQQQLNCRTVMGVLEDAGVHALSNVCHVDVERISKRKPGEVLPPHEPAVVKRAVNHFLQKNEGDIMVVDVRSIPRDFHARFKAQERTYFYRLLSGPEPLSTFEKDRAWHVPEELDLLAMQAACKVLVGHHDFSSFRAAGCQAKSPVKTLDELTVTEVLPTPYFPSIMERKQNNLTEKGPQAGLSADETYLGFGMKRRHRCLVVRLLVGVVKSVGTGNLTVSDVERILDAKTVTAASPMAPACGLYLGHVKYDLP